MTREEALKKLLALGLDFVDQILELMRNAPPHYRVEADVILQPRRPSRRT